MTEVSKNEDPKGSEVTAPTVTIPVTQSKKPLEVITVGGFTISPAFLEKSTPPIREIGT